MTIRVRMYDVGFGDCFLVSGGEPRWRILIDCGCHLSSSPTNGGSISDAARALIEDCRDGDGVARLDMVVVSHRHFDHIAGFDLPEWKAVEVAEVLLPWTENPDDPKARHIHNAQSLLEARLTELAAGRGTTKAAARELLALLELSNSGAMQTVHSDFKGAPKPRYLSGQFDVDPLELPGLPGVRIHVLGPATDEATIRDMDPPAGQSYLRLGSSDADGEPPVRPFPDAGPTHGGPGRDKDLRALERAIEDDLFDLAASLADSVNGTSLVLVIEAEGQRLLFPGDAQWGTWDRILGHDPWRELLTGTTFLKVGHHGSHNATPKRLVEEVLPDGIPAMISVRPIAKWPEIPREPLLEALRAKGITIIRSDTGAEAQLPGLAQSADERYWELDLGS